MVPHKDHVPHVVIYSKISLSILTVMIKNTVAIVDNILFTGTYYVDPNGGSIDDAFEVKCHKIDNVEWTCIEPKEKSHVR